MARVSSQIVPGLSNHMAIELLVTHIKNQLDSRSLRFRTRLARRLSAEDDNCASDQDEVVVLLEQKNQLKVGGHPSPDD